ncbi:hypothetical protein EON68_02475, partial [archaeon]
MSPEPDPPPSASAATDTNGAAPSAAGETLTIGTSAGVGAGAGAGAACPPRPAGSGGEEEFNTVSNIVQIVVKALTFMPYFIAFDGYSRLVCVFRDESFPAAEIQAAAGSNATFRPCEVVSANARRQRARAAHQGTGRSSDASGGGGGGGASPTAAVSAKYEVVASHTAQAKSATAHAVEDVTELVPHPALRTNTGDSVQYPAASGSASARGSFASGVRVSTPRALLPPTSLSPTSAVNGGGVTLRSTRSVDERQAAVLLTEARAPGSSMSFPPSGTLSQRKGYVDVCSMEAGDTWALSLPASCVEQRMYSGTGFSSSARARRAEWHTYLHAALMAQWHRDTGELHVYGAPAKSFALCCAIRARLCYAVQLHLSTSKTSVLLLQPDHVLPRFLTTTLARSDDWIRLQYDFLFSAGVLVDVLSLEGGNPVPSPVVAAFALRFAYERRAAFDNFVASCRVAGDWLHQLTRLHAY